MTKEKRSADHPAGRESTDAGSTERVEDFLRRFDAEIERIKAESSVAEQRGIQKAIYALAEALNAAGLEREVEAASEGERRRKAVHGEDS